MTRTNAFEMRRKALTRLFSVVATCGVALILGGCSGVGGPVSVDEGQLRDDLSTVEALVDVPMPESAYEYVDPSEWQTGEVTFKQAASDDGTVSVSATVPVSNDSYAAEGHLVATYAKGEDGSWAGSWQVESVDNLRAVSGIQRDEKRWDAESARVEFDEDAQTCTVYAPYEDPAWFETVDGELAYDYSFDGSGWAFEGVDESFTSITYESLAGVYDIEDGGGQNVTALEITDVAEDGTITARVSWRLNEPRLIYQRLFAPEDSATLTGKLVSAPAEGGEHRVVATLSGTTDTEGLPAAMSILAASDPGGVLREPGTIEYNLIVEAQIENRNNGAVDDLYSYKLSDRVSLLTDAKLSKDDASSE